MVLPEDGHAPPALLAPLLLLHHVVRAEALDALALHRDARVGHQQRGVEPKVEVRTVPGVGEETLRTWGENNYQPCISVTQVSKVETDVISKIQMILSILNKIVVFFYELLKIISDAVDEFEELSIIF